MTIREAIGVALITYSFIVPIMCIIGFRSKVKVLLFFFGNSFYMIILILGMSINNTIMSYNSISIILNSIIQEFGRYMMFTFFTAIDKTFSQYITSHRATMSKESYSEAFSETRSNRDLKIINFSNAAIFSGVGFAFGQIMNHFFIFMILLFGPGSPFYSTPFDDNFILWSSLLTLLRAIDHVSWNIIMFEGLIENNWFGPIVVVILHCSIALLSNYIRSSDVASFVILIIVFFVTSYNCLWAYQAAGGQIFMPKCCKDAPKTGNLYSESEMSRNFISPKSFREDTFENLYNRENLSALPLSKMVKKSVETENRDIQQIGQHVSFSGQYEK